MEPALLCKVIRVVTLGKVSDEIYSLNNNFKSQSIDLLSSLNLKFFELGKVLSPNLFDRVVQL